MRVGLVGFAGSGKTTVFNTMTGLQVPIAFGGELRYGIARVPDERIDKLSAMFKPKKTTFAEINFCDVPGEHGGHHKGLSAKSLQQIRDQEALCLVLRDFTHPTIEGDPDPLRDLEAFHVECVLADLDIIERKLERGQREKMPKLEQIMFEKMKSVLETEQPLRSISQQDLDRNALRGMGLLTDRPLLVAVNRDEARAAEALPDDVAARIQSLHAGSIVLSASVEAEIALLDLQERMAFLQDLGLEEAALDRFIRAAYALLDLISFFTVGEDEVRAWTIRRGTHARQAAGRIHSDLERGFIRAEVMPYDVFMKYGSEHAVKEAGQFKVEGKDYVVGDGDIMHIRFAV